MKNSIKAVLTVVVIVLTLISYKAEAQCERSTNPIATYNNNLVTWNFNSSLLVNDFENYWNITISDMYFDYSPGNDGLLTVIATDSLNNPANFSIEIEGIPNLLTGVVDIYFKEYEGNIPCIRDWFKKHTCTSSGNCNLCEYSSGVCNCTNIPNPDAPVGTCIHQETTPSWGEIAKDCLSIILTTATIVALCL